MNNLSAYPGNTPKGEPNVPSSHTKNHERNSAPTGLGWFLHLWYRIASPPEPLSSASFQERELFRRGRTGSQITIFLYILIFISFPAAFAGSNALLITILVIDLFVLTLALILNHFKKVSMAGILVVISMAASPTVNILTTPGGVNASALPIFNLLVLPLMCAVSFLPAWWVFVVGVGNCIFTLCVLLGMPSSGELHTLLKTALPGIVTPIIISQVIVAIVAFLWVRGATQAIQRADRAEEIAELEAIEIQRKEEQLVISKQVEEGIQQIITSMNSVVAQNDFTIRIPLKQENVLWRVGRSINNLLARLQGLKQDQEELKRTHAVAAEILHYMNEGAPIKLEAWTGTVFDPIIIEYNKRLQNIPRK